MKLNVQLKKQKNQHIKSMLNLHFFIKNMNESLGFVVCSEILNIKNKLNQLNKKTILFYLDFFYASKFLNYTPKFPNFYYKFDSWSDITKKDLVNSLFLKIGYIYCYSKIFDINFLNFYTISILFTHIFLNLQFYIFSLFVKLKILDAGEFS